MLSRLATKLNSVWLDKTYPFAGFGRNVSIHHSCEIGRAGSRHIYLGDGVYLAPDVWLNATPEPTSSGPKIILSKGCKIGRRSTISARNRIMLEEDVLLAPSVLIMDHNHEYSDPDTAIHQQGITAGGRITIGRNCWLGYNSVIFCGSGELVLGHNCVVGANAVVTKSFPANSVVGGNPAVLLKTYDRDSQQWVRAQRDDFQQSAIRRADAIGRG